MSFFTRIAPVTTRASLAPTVGRASAVSAARPAFFSTTVSREDKGPVDVTKETLKKADRVVSGAAVKGIETGEKASHKVKEKLHLGKKKAEEEGHEIAKEGKEAAAETKQGAKKKADELAEDAQKTSEQWTGKA